MTTRWKLGTAPRARSAKRVRRLSCRSLRTVQHRQPLPSSTAASLEARSSASSIPTSPNSLMTMAVLAPSGVRSSSRISVVLPEPRKPVTTVTGMRAPRAVRVRRPNGNASAPAKSSAIGAKFKAITLSCHTGESRYPQWQRPGSDKWVPAFAGMTMEGDESEIHFEGVEAADVAVDAEHDAAVVDKDVVDLAGAGRRVRHLRDEVGDFLRLVGVRGVVGPEAAVEEGGE